MGKLFKSREIKVHTQGDVYKHYLKRGGKLSQGKFSDVCRGFNARIYDKMIKDGFEFKLPYNLGMLRIKAIKPKIKTLNGEIIKNSYPIDWPRTRKLWEEMYSKEEMSHIRDVKDKPLVYHENDHSNGYRMIVVWDRSLIGLKGTGMYGFHPAKGGLFNGYYYGRRGLSRWLMYNSDSDSNIYNRNKYYGI